MPRSQTFNGRNGKYRISLQDGTGRVQHRWNASKGKTSQYENSNEPAFFMNMAVTEDPYFSINYAESGKKKEKIDWTQHLNIMKDGKVGIGLTEPAEKLDVNGRIKCKDIIVTDGDCLAETLNITVEQRTTASDIYEAKRNAIVTMTMVYGNSIYSGTGFFISSDGWLATVAHNLISNSRTDTADEVYVTVTNMNGELGKHRFIRCTEFYVDGAGDIGIVRVPGITNQTYMRFRSTDDVKPGERAFMMGDPMGADMQSMSEGIVRDPHYTDPYGEAVTDNILVDTVGYGGNSGSPIVDADGYAIGLYSFGYSGTDALGGGPNHSVIETVLDWMMNNRSNYVVKRYIGIGWSVFSASKFLQLFSNSSYEAKGVYINSISTESPFYVSGVRAGDILLEFDGYDMGAIEGQYCPTKPTWLITNEKTVTIKYYDRSANSQKTTTVTLNKDFTDRGSSDVPLLGNNRILIRKQLTSIKKDEKPNC